MTIGQIPEEILLTSDGWLSKANNKEAQRYRQIVVSGRPLIGGHVEVDISVGHNTKLVWRSDGHGMQIDGQHWVGGIWTYTDTESWTSYPLIAGHPPFKAIHVSLAPTAVQACIEHGRNILNWLGVRPLVTYEVIQFAQQVAMRKVTGAHAWRAVKTTMKAREASE